STPGGGGAMTVSVEPSVAPPASSAGGVAVTVSTNAVTSVAGSRLGLGDDSTHVSGALVGATSLPEEAAGPDVDPASPAPRYNGFDCSSAAMPPHATWHAATKR